MTDEEVLTNEVGRQNTPASWKPQGAGIAPLAIQQQPAPSRATLKTQIHPRKTTILQMALLQRMKGERPMGRLQEGSRARVAPERRSIQRSTTSLNTNLEDHGV